MLGRIYKITSPSTDKIYIGSTTLTLNVRFSLHKFNKNCSSIEIMKYGDSQIELLEELEGVDREELLWKERKYQERFKESCVNKMRAIITEDEYKIRCKEYYDANREAKKIKHKAYREANKEALKISKKAYYEANKEAKKAYREATKEARKNYNKEYRARKKMQVQMSHLILPTYTNDNTGTL